MMDFAVLPPEVNSGRMYAGAGAGPLVTAAAAWDRLAAMLGSAAGSYQAVVTELTGGPWRGPSSASMTAAADPYVTWMNTTAAQAEQAATQARAAAAAYETAFAATVPPPVIATNRALLAALVATNFFGQNTPAIAANQAEYGEMWAQDASTMYSYAATSAAASTLPPFVTPAENTNPAGIGNQAGATAQTTGSSAAAATQNTLSTVPNALTSMANPLAALDPILDNPTVSALNTFLGTLGGTQLNMISPLFVSEAALLFEFMLMTSTGKLAMLTPVAGEAAMAAGLASSVSEGAPGLTLAGSYGTGGPGAAGLGNAGMSAGLGRAMPVGGLSVPGSWETATSPGIRLAAAALPTGGSAGLSGVPMAAPGGFVGGPVGSVVNAPRNGEQRVRSGSSFKAIPDIAREAGADEGTSSRWAAQPNGSAPKNSSTLSDRERDELNGLREQIGDLAMDCDAMARLMREAMR